MDDKRRARVLQYFKEKFKDDHSAIIRATGYSKGRITQLYDSKEPLGERAGRSVAQRLRLDESYFERDRDPSAPGLSREALDFAAAYERLDAAGRQKMRLLLMVAMNGINPTEIQPAPRDASFPPDSMLGGDSGLGALEETPSPRKKSNK